MTCPYALASKIEWINAAARVRMTPRRRGQRINDLIANEYDPLAATELGSLLEKFAADHASTTGISALSAEMNPEQSGAA